MWDWKSIWRNTKSTTNYFIIKCLKIKYREKILKTTREKKTLSEKEHHFKWQWISHLKLWKLNIFQVLKEKNCQPQIFYSVKLTFRNKGKIKSFSDKEILREYVACISILRGSSPNRKKITEGGWDIQEGKTNNEMGKNRTKYNRLSFTSWVSLIIYCGWSRIYVTWYGIQYIEKTLKTIVFKCIFQL